MDVRHTFRENLDRLAREVVAMGTLVRRSIDEAVDSLYERDTVAASRVIRDDRRIDAAQLALEDHAVAILGTEQPVATDLRRLVMTLKVAGQLERMGDYAAHIARAALILCEDTETAIPPSIRSMSSTAVLMLMSALRAFAETRPQEVHALGRADQTVDGLHRETVRTLLDRMRANPDTIGACLEILHVSRSIERVADQATNIGEWVVYGETGRRISLNP